MDTIDRGNDPDFVWPYEDTSRVPFQVYTDEELYRVEQKKVFQGNVWNFLCLECEIPEPGDYKTTYAGDTPIIAVRDEAGNINAMVNRCAHKGSLVCYKPRGNVKELACVYHNWVYDLRGNLTAVAFRRGVGGKGGLTDEFKNSEHGLQQLRIEVFRGLVFGTFSEKTEPVADYLGDELVSAVDRVLIKPLKVLGYYSQIFKNNWKLYVENNKDSYHASLLHVFHNTFGVVRPNMGGGIKISDSGWHHLSYTERTDISDDEIVKENVRSKQDAYSLEDPTLMEHKLELGDNVTNNIQTIFPTLVIQQILNCLAVRQLIPKGVNESELIWTILGFEDDDEEMIQHRVSTNNLVGPAGFISMEDGAVGAWVQRAAKSDRQALTVMPMGGRAIEPSQGSRVTEAAVRGFWKGWRECMEI